MWRYFGGSTTKIPPHLPPNPAIPREPSIMEVFAGFAFDEG